MKYTYACKKVPLNDSIKDYAEKRVEKLEKYFHRDDASAFVTFTVEKDKLCTVEITSPGWFHSPPGADHRTGWGYARCH